MLCTLCCALWGHALAQSLAPGDLIFTAYNADGDDGLAFVTFVDLEANTTVYFTDNEWTVPDNQFNDGESFLTWVSGDTILPAGTVVALTGLSADSVQSTAGSVSAGSLNLNASNEGLFAYLGTAPEAPTLFLSAVTNGSQATSFGTLDNTGLVAGATAIVLPNGADVADYTGPRQGLDPAGYRIALNNPDNYAVQDGSGDQSADGMPPDLPFDTTPFILGGSVELPEVSFDESFAVAFESDGTVQVPVVISSGTLFGGSVMVLVEGGTAVETNDYNLAAVNFAIPEFSGSDTIINLDLELLDDSDIENTEYVALRLLAIDNAVVGESQLFVQYIQDDDTPTITPSEALTLTFATSYLVKEGGAAEIVAGLPTSKILAVTNSTDNELILLRLESTREIIPIDTLDLSTFGGTVNSVAAIFDPQNEGVANAIGFAVALEADSLGQPGSVVIINPEGQLLAQVEVGVQPDHISIFGNTAVTANEGEPNEDYTVDPEGSISIIELPLDLSTLAQANVTTIGFAGFNGQEEELRSAGIRIFGPQATVAQDLEPEYATFNEDGTTAFVTLQENNAVAVVDLTVPEVTNLFPLGFKNHLLRDNPLDASNDSDTILLANWPILGMYQPDGIAYFQNPLDQTPLLITANEGDGRDYDGFSEESDFKDLMLDLSTFPNAEVLQADHALGPLTVTTANGDTDNDGQYEEVYVFGGRSFSIWNALEGNLVYDSGAELERLTATDPEFGSLFNASNSNNSFKNRSDNKGPEPEGVIVATIDGTPYAFLGLERIGGVVAINLANPSAPVITDYVNSRTLGEEAGGDLGPEGILYLPPVVGETVAVDTGLVIVANEVSGTLSIYTIDQDVVSSVSDPGVLQQPFSVYPNPIAGQGTLFFSEPAAVELFDLHGRLILQQPKSGYLDLPSLARGMYLLRTRDGRSAMVRID